MEKHQGVASVLLAAHMINRKVETIWTQNTPDDSGQHYWRWCNKCQGMFYAGHGTGTCSSGGGHDPNASGDYSLAQNVGESGGENNWCWCNKCQGLFFAGHQSGVCPQGGGHDKMSSGDYSIPVAIRVSADNCPSVFEIGARHRSHGSRRHC